MNVLGYKPEQMVLAAVILILCGSLVSSGP